MDWLDIQIFYLLNFALQNPLFDVLIPVLTTREYWFIPLGAVWLLLIFKGGPKGREVAILAVAIITISDQLTSSLIKPLVGRIRPCNVLGSVHFWSSSEGWIYTPPVVSRILKGSFSFPSGHAANIFAGALLFSYYYRRVTVPSLIIASSVAYSRVYVGVHYPSDILGGAILGSLCSYTVIWTWCRIRARIGRDSIK